MTGNVAGIVRKTAMSLARAFPGTGLDYFLNMPLYELVETAMEAVEVTKRNGK